MQNIPVIFMLLCAYLIGSLPTALLLGRMRGIDIRREGSGNVGATNVLRVMGRGWGILCLAIDLCKGWLPVILIGKVYLLASVPALTQDAWMWLAGLAAIAGHMFNPFLRFKGGKGVATSIGVLLAIAPLPLLVAVLVGLLLIWLTGYVSLASITCSALLPFLILLDNLRGHVRIQWTTFGVTVLLALVIAWKHRANIARLRAGTESRIFDRLDRHSGAKDKTL